MYPRPQGLAGELSILNAQLSGRGGVVHRAAQEVESLHAGSVRFYVLFSFETLRELHHEGGAVVVGIFESEFDIGHQAATQTLQGLTRLLQDLCEALLQPHECFRADLFEEFGFVPEVEVDGGRRVFNLVGDAPHGNVLEALADKEFAGGIEDLLAEIALLPSSTFPHAHSRDSPKLVNGVKYLGWWLACQGPLEYDHIP